MATLNEIKAMDKEVLVPDDIAPIIGCNPHWIRIMARTEPEKLGFPVICIGNRVKIPRRAFVNFMERGGKSNGRNDS